jgi:hypothetical protein
VNQVLSSVILRTIYRNKYLTLFFAVTGEKRHHTPIKKSKGRVDNQDAASTVSSDEDSSDLFLSPLSPSPPPPIKHSLARKDIRLISVHDVDDDAPSPVRSSSTSKVKQSLEFEHSNQQENYIETRQNVQTPSGSGHGQEEDYLQCDAMPESQGMPSGSLRQIPESQFSMSGRETVRETPPLDKARSLLGAEQGDRVQKQWDNEETMGEEKSEHIPGMNNTADPNDDGASASSGSLPSLSPLPFSPDHSPSSSPDHSRPQSPRIERPSAEGTSRSVAYARTNSVNETLAHETVKPGVANKSFDAGRIGSQENGAEDPMRKKVLENTVEHVEEEALADHELPRWQRSKFGFISSGLDTQKAVRIKIKNACAFFSLIQ